MYQLEIQTDVQAYIRHHLFTEWSDCRPAINILWCASDLLQTVLRAVLVPFGRKSEIAVRRKKFTAGL